MGDVYVLLSESLQILDTLGDERLIQDGREPFCDAPTSLSAPLMHEKWRKTKYNLELQIVVYLYVATFSGFYIGIMAAAKPKLRQHEREREGRI